LRKVLCSKEKSQKGAVSHHELQKFGKSPFQGKRGIKCHPPRWGKGFSRGKREKGGTVPWPKKGRRGESKSKTESKISGQKEILGGEKTHDSPLKGLIGPSRKINSSKIMFRHERGGERGEICEKKKNCQEKDGLEISCGVLKKDS